MKRLICAVLAAIWLTLGVSADESTDTYDELIMEMSLVKTAKFQHELRRGYYLLEEYDNGLNISGDEEYDAIRDRIGELYEKLAPVTASRELLETLTLPQTYTIDGITMTDLADFAEAYGGEYDIFAVYREVDGYKVYDVTVQNNSITGGLLTTVGGDKHRGTQVLGDDSKVRAWEDVLFSYTVGYEPTENSVEVLTSRDATSGVTKSGLTQSYELRIDAQSDIHFVFVNGTLAYMYNTAAVVEWHDYHISTTVDGSIETDFDSFAGAFDCYPRYYNTRIKRAIDAYKGGTSTFDPLGSYTRTVTADGGTAAVFTLGFECPTDDDVPFDFLVDETPRSYTWVAVAGGIMALLAVLAATILKLRRAK